LFGGRECPCQHFLFDLETDVEEEDRHQAIIDPKQQRLVEIERADSDRNRRIEQCIVQWA
jgi:hypothetical protein